MAKNKDDLLELTVDDMLISDEHELPENETAETDLPEDTMQSLEMLATMRIEEQLDQFLEEELDMIIAQMLPRILSGAIEKILEELPDRIAEEVTPRLEMHLAVRKEDIISETLTRIGKRND